MRALVALRVRCISHRCHQRGGAVQPHREAYKYGPTYSFIVPQRHLQAEVLTLARETMSHPFSPPVGEHVGLSGAVVDRFKALTMNLWADFQFSPETRGKSESES